MRMLPQALCAFFFFCKTLLYEVVLKKHINFLNLK